MQSVNSLKKSLFSDKNLILGLLTISLFAIGYAVCPIAYMTNDDFWIMTETGGYFVDWPSTFHWYLNPIFSWGMSRLYSHFSGVNWYPIFHVFCIIFSVLVINSCVYYRLMELKVSAWKSCMVIVTLYFILFAYPAVTLSFTVSSAIVGAAAIACVYTYSFHGEHWLSVTLIEISMCFGSFIWREDTGRVAFCFFSLALVYRVVSDWNCSSDKKEKKRVLLCGGLCVAILVIAVLSAVLVENYYYSSAELSNYVKFQQARFKYMDYPHESYADNPQRYDAAGISRALSLLLNNWFFLDHRITADAFSALSDYSSGLTEMVSNFSLAIENKDLTNFLAENPYAICVMVWYLVLFAFSMYKGYQVIIHTEKGNRFHSVIDVLMEIALLCGVFCLLAYLYLKRRLILRAFLTVIIPAVSGSVLVLLDILHFRDKLNAKKHKKHGMINVLIVFLLVLSLVGTHFVVNSETISQRKESFSMTQEMFEFAENNPNNIYIYDVSLINNIDTSIYYRVGQGPRNLLFYGGCSMYAPSFYRQISSLGIENIDSDVFLQDNVYYMSKGWGIEELLLDYLKEAYGAVEIECVDTIGHGINLYKFN